ncbi:MAG: hypothetical protein RL692_546, partial [Planctomycetota bacterium]
KRRVASQSPHFLKMALLSNKVGFEAKRMDSKVIRADFGSGLICPRTQTCMDSKVVRAVVWQRTDLPSGSNMLRAEIQRALMRAPRQLRRLARLANSPGFKSFRCPRERIKFSLERFSDSVSHLFACPAVEKFCRASSAGGRRHLQ